jgi:hypothetical protein
VHGAIRRKLRKKAACFGEGARHTRRKTAPSLGRAEPAVTNLYPRGHLLAHASRNSKVNGRLVGEGVVIVAVFSYLSAAFRGVPRKLYSTPTAGQRKVSSLTELDAAHPR